MATPRPDDGRGCVGVCIELVWRWITVLHSLTLMTFLRLSVQLLHGVIRADAGLYGTGQSPGGGGISAI